MMFLAALALFASHIVMPRVSGALVRIASEGEFSTSGAKAQLKSESFMSELKLRPPNDPLVFSAPQGGAATQGAGRAECRSVNSKILSRAVPYCIFLPPSYDSDAKRRFPVLYFLHGLGENEQVLLNSDGWQIIESAWAQKTLGEFIIVAPAAGRSFYVNSRDGKVRYEDFFIREFIPAIEGGYRIRAERRSRGLDGISMGGYGALRLALKYPQMFGSVSAHSAALIERPPDVKINPQQQGAISRLVGTA